MNSSVVMNRSFAKKILSSLLVAVYLVSVIGGLNLVAFAAEDNAYLVDLEVNGETVQDFEKSTLEYNINVDFTCTQVLISAQAEDTNAVISGDTGFQDIVTGLNTFTVTVTAEDGIAAKTYTLNITKEEDTSPIVSFDCSVLKQAIIHEDIDYNNDGELSENEMASLDSLYLSDAYITSFTGLNYALNITSLHIAGINKINVPTLVSDVFNGLSSLESLSISGDNFATLESGCFNGLSSLTSINIHNTSISSLPSNIFSELSNLEYLTINDSPLLTLNGGCFNGLCNLIGLYIGHSEITILQNDLFSELSSIDYISFYDSKIESFESGCFNGLSSLIKLNLEGNRLTNFNVGIFDSLTSLEELRLRWNLITEIEADVFKNLPNLNELYLEYNFLNPLEDSEDYAELMELNYIGIYSYMPHMSYDIILDFDGGAGNQFSKYFYHDELFELPLPTKTNYSFLGWDTDSDGIEDTEALVQTSHAPIPPCENNYVNTPWNVPLSVTYTAIYLSNNPYLADISIGETTIDNFAYDTYSYDITVDSTTESVDISSVSDDANSVITGDTDNQALSPGLNTFTITCTAEDGTTSQDYTLNITREIPLNNDASLSNLTINSATIDGFSSTIYSYDISVDNSTESVVIGATSTDGNASISGDVGTLNLSNGLNTFTITCTAEDGITSQDYVLNIAREVPLSTDATLSDLTIDSVTVDGFSPDTRVYEIVVDASTTSVVIGADSSDANATISGAIGLSSLAPGSNTFYLKCTAEDGVTYKYYTLNIMRLYDVIITDDDYVFDTYTGTIVRYFGDETDLVIPNAIAGVNVVSIGNGAFKSCYDLISVTIPSSVTYIEEKAFQYCSNLVSINLPENITSIQDYTFHSCYKLINIIIHEGIISIGKYAFSYCDSFVDILLPDSLEFIDESAFFSCDNLSSITIPDKVTRIENRTFLECEKLKSITLHDGILFIGEDVFAKSGITSITIPKNASISVDTFDNCDSLTEIIVDDAHSNFKSIDGVVFSKDGSELIRCPEGKAGEYSIPANTVIISTGAFKYCHDLIDILIPEGITSIQEEAFLQCEGLTNIILPSSISSIEYKAFCACPNLRYTTIKSNVTNFEDYAFYSNHLNLAFYGYRGSDAETYANDNLIPFIDLANSSDLTLYDLTIDDTTISGFDNTIYSYDIQVEYSVESITIGAVANDSNFLISGDIGLKSLLVGDNVFAVTCSLEDETAKQDYILIITRDSIISTDDGFVFDIDTGTIIDYIGTATDLLIPATIEGFDVKIIGEEAFMSASTIENVNISYGIEKIEYCAFANNSNLVSVSLPNSLLEIGGYIFWLTPVSELIIPNNVQKLGDFAFVGTRALVDVTIPESVTEIGEHPFAACSNLANINVSPQNQFYKSIDGVLFTKDGITLIGYPAAKEGESYDIPEGVEYIGPYSFWNACFDDVFFPDSLKRIGSYAFNNYSSPNSIILPPNVTTLDDDAFKDSGLNEIFIPPSVIYFGSDVFDDKYDKPIIYGEEGSAAHIFAINNSIPFQDPSWSSISTISNITIDSVPISGFNPNIFDYEAIMVEYSTDSIEVIATPTDNDATVTGDVGNVNLHEGLNVLFITCTAENDIEENTYIIRVFRKRGGKVAILFGMADYIGTENDLDGPGNDVTGMGAVLQHSGYTVYKYMNYTAENLLSAVQTIASGMSPEGTLLFYYSGHGSDGGYLVGSDLYGISINDLESRLSQHTGTKEVIIDACFSGDFISKGVDGIESNHLDSADDFNDYVISVFSNNVNQLESKDFAQGNYYVMTACSGSQYSYEYFWELSSSPFAMNNLSSYPGYPEYFCLGYFSFYFQCGFGLYEDPQLVYNNADYNLDDIITWTEIYQFARYYTSDDQSAQVYPVNSNHILYQASALDPTELHSYSYPIGSLSSVIFNVSDETTLADFEATFSNPASQIHVYTPSGAEITSGYVGTDMTVKLEINETVEDELKICVLGDVNSDGIIDILDYSYIKLHIFNVLSLQDLCFNAGDIDYNGVIDIIDYSYVKLDIFGVSSIN